MSNIIPDKINVIGLRSEDLKPLNIKCTKTKCKEELHCFCRYMKRAEKKFGKKGVCHICGDGSIDWQRIQKNNIKDSEYIFRSLNKELIRKVFSTIIIEQRAIEEAKKLGKKLLREHARKILKSRIGKFNAYIDNRQTPLGKDDIINYAQHATATCCRACLEAWYNISKESVLTELQLKFCLDLIMLYIIDKIPDIKE